MDVSTVIRLQVLELSSNPERQWFARPPFCPKRVTKPEEVQRHLDRRVVRVSGTDACAVPFLGHPLPRGPRVKFRGEESAKTPGFAQPNPTTKREGPTQLGLRGTAWRELGLMSGRVIDKFRRN
jgi:hypothetical protein